MREHTLRLVLDNEGQQAPRWQAIMSIAAKIGCAPQTLNDWVKHADVDSGKRPDVFSDMAERMKALERENRALRQANEIFSKAGARFAVALLRFEGKPQEGHRAAHRVEPTCKIPEIAPATYYDHLAKRADPTRLSDHAKRNEALRPEIQQVFSANLQGYGVRKVWPQLRQEGCDVARCTIAKLMKVLGIQGVTRGKSHKTTIPDKKLPCPLDKAIRQFRMRAPNMLWVSSFTIGATLKRFACLAVVIDADACRILS